MATIDGSMTKLVSALVVIVAATALGPTIFEALANGTDFANSAPAWVVTLVSLMAGIGLVFIVWKAIK